MSVVVQTMVAPHAAGVLFTRHPLNGDPRVMVITANYGLGESVVSAKSDPDTFYVKRSYDENVEMIGTKLGEKKVLIKMDDAGSTVEIECDEENKKKSCMNDDVVLKVAKLGIVMEKLFGTPRDIEFAVYGDKIYLLQSRPITSLNNYSDYEIEHELDSAVMGDCCICTRANVGEVVQGPSTALGSSCLIEPMEKMMLKLMKKEDRLKCVRNFFLTFSHHMFMNVALVGMRLFKLFGNS